MVVPGRSRRRSLQCDDVERLKLTVREQERLLREKDREIRQLQGHRQPSSSRPLPVLLAVLMCVVVLGVALWSTDLLKDTQLMAQTTPKSDRTKGTRGSIKRTPPTPRNTYTPPKSYPTDPISPFTSTPPDPVETIDASAYPSTEAVASVKVRHQCIAKIRQEHHSVLTPLFLPGSTVTNNDKDGLLVDPAYHSNVGDHLITLGEIVYLERLGYAMAEGKKQTRRHQPLIRQCGYLQDGGFVPRCSANSVHQTFRNIPDTAQRAPAIWHGGGNWGDLWRSVQDVRVASFDPLLSRNYTIVGMPQSFHYQKEAMIQRDVNMMRSGIARGLGLKSVEDLRDLGHERVHLGWREIESYERAKELYPFVHNFLIPDIAFQLGPYEPMRTPEKKALKLDILLFLRKDLESVVAGYRNPTAIRELLEKVEGGRDLKFQIVDWEDRLGIFQMRDYFFTSSSIQLLSLGRVVVCDRLHAAILCYLSGIPFVFVDQVSGKISKTLRVALGVDKKLCADSQKGMWSRAESLPQALEMAADMIDRYSL